MNDIDNMEFYIDKSGSHKKVDVICDLNCLKCPLDFKIFVKLYPNIKVDYKQDLTCCASRLKAYRDYQTSKLEALL